MKYNPDIHHRRSIRLKGYDYSQNGLYFITICTQNREHLFGTITNGQMALNPMGEIAHNEWFKTESMRPNIRLHEFIVMPNHIHGIIEIIPVGAHCMRPLDVETNNNDPQSQPSEQLGRVQRATNGVITDHHGQSESGHGQHAGNIVGAHCMRPLDVPPTPTNRGITDNHGESEQLGRVQRAPTGNGGQRVPTVGDIVRGYKSAVTKRINALRNTPGLPMWLTESAISALEELRDTLLPKLMSGEVRVNYTH